MGKTGKKRGVRRYFRERGSMLAFVAFMLPIALAGFMATIDLARFPVMRERVRHALVAGAFRAEEAAASGAGLGVVDVLDPYMPAVNRFCLMSKLLGSTDLHWQCDVDNLGSKVGFLSGDVATDISQGACVKAKDALLNADSGAFDVAGPNGGGLVKWAFHYSIVVVEKPALPPINNLASIYPISFQSCGSDGPNTFQYFHDKVGVFTPMTVAEKLVSQFAVQTVGGLYRGAGLWAIQRKDAASATELDVSATPINVISSGWLIGVGFIEFDHFFTMFGDSRIIVDHFIRPLNVPAGIETNGFSGGEVPLL